MPTINPTCGRCQLSPPSPPPLATREAALAEAKLAKVIHAMIGADDLAVRLLRLLVRLYRHADAHLEYRLADALVAAEQRDARMRARYGSAA